MNKEEILNKLNSRLEELIKEYPTRTISSLRKDTLKEFKKNGIIKDYQFRSNVNQKNRTNNTVFYFGSLVGFDSLYIVKI